MTTQDGDDYVVRVQKHSVNSFAEEAWAMRRCREVGLPVPEVYGVGQLDTTEPREAMVTAVARGRPLATKLEQLTKPQMARVFKAVGQALSKMHDVSLSRFGWLHELEGAAEPAPDWPAYARTLLEFRQDDVAMLERAGLTANEITDLLTIVADMQDLPYQTPVLCHGDLGADHLFFDEELNLVDMIDFGMVQGSAPALDIGVLLMFHPEVNTAWLAEGYGADFASERFEREVLSHQTNVGMSHLAESLRRGDESFKDIAVFGLRGWLERWRNLEN